MIRKVLPYELEEVKDFLERDILRNYFILLGMVHPEDVYENIYVEWENNRLIAGLFKRKSGNLQFYGEEGFDIDGFTTLISTMEYKSLIGAKSYCDHFLSPGIFSTCEEGAYLSKLDKNSYIDIPADEDVFPLKIEDLDEVVSIYQEVFPSFAPKITMEEKLRTGRGRGICIKKEGKILSLAQSEFEVDNGALIVGVATRPELQGQGLGSKVLKLLCKELLAEGKNLYLQYDNLEAGKIYERLGFEIIDRICHYEK